MQNNFNNVLRNCFIRFVTTKTRINARGQTVPVKKKVEESITLIDQEDEISITALSVAQKISNSKNLKLVKIQDTDIKSRRPVYKMMTSGEYHETELQRRAEKLSKKITDVKNKKLLPISSNIGINDLNTRIKNLIKWITKRHEVRVIISNDGGSEQNKLESIYQQIEQDVKSTGKISQKVYSGNNLKFQVLPIKTDNGITEDQQSFSTNSFEDNKPL